MVLESKPYAIRERAILLFSEEPPPAVWLPRLVDIDNKLHCILILKYNMLKILVEFKFPKDY